MDDTELARWVAADIGGTAVSETEGALRGEKTRSISIAAAVSVGSFIVTCAQTAMQVWQARHDRALLVEALLEKAPASPLLDPDRDLGIIARIVDKIVPQAWGTSPSLGAIAEKTKQQWIAEWLASHPPQPDGELAARGFSRSVILEPFADMENFCLYRSVTWTPPAALAGKLPTVTVPRGFVTDLASIPKLFWSLLPPQGRYGYGAIVHDWLYWDQSTTRAIADQVLEAAMEEMSVAPVPRRAIYSSVRVFGGPYWDSDARSKAGGAKLVVKKFPETPDVTWADWRQRPDVLA